MAGNDAKYLGSMQLARQRVRDIFGNRNVGIPAGGETSTERVNRIAREVLSGERTFDDVRRSVDRIQRQQGQPYAPDRPDDPGPRTSIPTPPPTRRDFYSEARSMFPWLDRRLVREFADAWSETDSTDLAWSQVRQGATYRKLYSAILRDDGTLRMSELEYASVKDGYRQRLASYGLNPNLFEGKFDDLVSGDVSPQEFEGRLQAGWENVSSRSQATRQWYADNYGRDLSDAALFASYIDPDIGTAVLERRLSNAQIGGAAAQFNFRRSLERIDELRGLGVTGEQAQQFYSRAAADLPGASARSERHNRGAFTLTDLEEAGLEGDADERQRLLRSVDDEAALFGRGGPARGDDRGRRTGLNPV